MKKTLNILFAVVCAIAMAAGVQARDQDPVGLTPTTEDAQGIAKKPSYSPYAERGFPTQVFWGDTHVHTDNSLDARGFGVTLGPEEAFRFARGEEVTTSTGQKAKLSRPLDWLAITDHSDGMGAMKEIIKGNPNLLSDPKVKQWHNAMNAVAAAATTCATASIATTWTPPARRPASPTSPRPAACAPWQNPWPL